MKYLRLSALLSITASVFVPAAVYSDDDVSWNQWRGPERSAVADTLDSPMVDWSKTPRTVWQTAVGEGQASPVIAGGLVFVFDRVDGRERIAAYRLESGEQVWERSDEVKFKPGMGGGHYGAGPKATPVVVEGKVVTYGVTSLLTVRDAETGKLIWRRDLKEEEDDPVLYWGNSMSPIVDNGRVVIQFGNDRSGGIRAYDLETGKPGFSIQGEGSSYSSPISFDLDERTVIAMMTWQGLLGLTAEGEILFRQKLAMSHTRQNTATPVFHQDIVVYTGENRPLTAVRLKRNETAIETQRLWSRDDLPHDLASPIAFDDRICGFTTRNRGQAFCLDLETGSDLWRGPARFGEFITLTVASDRLLVGTEDGRLLILNRKADSWSPIVEHQLADSELWTQPALVGSSLIVKSRNRLERLDFAPR